MVSGTKSRDTRAPSAWNACACGLKVHGFSLRQRDHVVRGRCRHYDGERRTLAIAEAPHFDRAPVQFDDLLRDGEAEAEARRRARRRRILLPETLEDVRQKGRRYSLPGVLNRHPQLTLAAVHVDFHAAAVRRELDRVVHEVPHNLLKAARIADDLSAARLD